MCKSGLNSMQIAIARLQSLTVAVGLILGLPQLAVGQQHALRATSTVVLVPTLVESKAGDIVYGLSAKDFRVQDNGVIQPVKVDSDFDMEPFSVVVAIQCGRDAPGQFGTFRHLGLMLDSMMGQVPHEMAVVIFDSHPYLLQDFTSDATSVSSALHRLGPGDGGAAIDDAVGYSLLLLARQPEQNRRVLLIISETRDHGSRMATVHDLLQRVAGTNITIYSLSFSPAASELSRDLHGQYDGPEFTLMEPFQFAANAMRHNTANSLSKISGGEYLRFNSKLRFDHQLNRLANDLHSRYLLTFQPDHPQAGYHSIQVRLKKKSNAVVVARPGYWATASSAPDIR